MMLIAYYIYIKKFTKKKNKIMNDFHVKKIDNLLLNKFFYLNVKNFRMFENYHK